MDDKNLDRLSKATIVASTGAANLLMAASGSPELAGLLGGTAAAITVGIDGANRRRGERVAIAAAIGAEELDSTVDALIENLLQNDAKAELLAAVFEGAARAIDRKKLLMLGRSLAAGARTDDGAALHHEVFMAKLMADLELPHLKILQYMEKDPEAEGHLRLARRNQLLELFKPQAMSASVIATLLRHALLQGYSHAEFERSFSKETRLRARVNEHTSEPVVYMITSLGEYTPKMYRDAGSS